MTGKGSIVCILEFKHMLRVRLCLCLESADSNSCSYYKASATESVRANTGSTGGGLWHSDQFRLRSINDRQVFTYCSALVNHRCRQLLRLLGLCIAVCSASAPPRSRCSREVHGLGTVPLPCRIATVWSARAEQYYSMRSADEKKIRLSPTTSAEF